MNFKDRGIIINHRNFGEDSLIIKIFSSQNGVYSGFIKKAKSSKKKYDIQIGNLVEFEFRRSGIDNLAKFIDIDNVKSFASLLLFEKFRLSYVSSLFSIINRSFLENQNHQNLFVELLSFLELAINFNVSDKILLTYYIKAELQILKELGYGLDFSKCAVSNKTDDLAFVSPKTGRAVCFEVGVKYGNKLFKLPQFLLQNHNIKDDYNLAFSNQDLIAGLELSEYFFNKFVFQNEADKKELRNFSKNNLLANSD